MFIFIPAIKEFTLAYSEDDTSQFSLKTRETVERLVDVCILT